MQARTAQRLKARREGAREQVGPAQVAPMQSAPDTSATPDVEVPRYVIPIEIARKDTRPRGQGDQATSPSPSMKRVGSKDNSPASDAVTEGPSG